MHKQQLLWNRRVFIFCAQDFGPAVCKFYAVFIYLFSVSFIMVLLYYFLLLHFIWIFRNKSNSSKFHDMHYVSCNFIFYKPWSSHSQLDWYGFVQCSVYTGVLSLFISISWTHHGYIRINLNNLFWCFCIWYWLFYIKRIKSY